MVLHAIECLLVVNETQTRAGLLNRWAAAHWWAARLFPVGREANNSKEYKKASILVVLNCPLLLCLCEIPDHKLVIDVYHWSQINGFSSGFSDL